MAPLPLHCRRRHGTGEDADGNDDDDGGVSAARRWMEMERRLRELEEGPALSRYGTTTRPLNRFASRGGGTDKFKEHRGGGGPLVRRPPVRRSSSALAPPPPPKYVE